MFKAVCATDPVFMERCRDVCVCVCIDTNICGGRIEVVFTRQQNAFLTLVVQTNKTLTLVHAHVPLLLVRCVKRERVSPRAQEIRKLGKQEIIQGVFCERRQDLLVHNGKIIIKHVKRSQMGRKGDGSLLGYFHLQFLRNSVYFGFQKRHERHHKATVATWLLILQLIVLEERRCLTLRSEHVYPVAGIVEAGVGGMFHVSFWSFKREFLISSGLTWLMFIVAVVRISRLPLRTRQNCLLCLTACSLLNYAVS